MIRANRMALYGLGIVDVSMEAAADKLVSEVKRAYLLGQAAVKGGSFYSLSTDATNAAKANIDKLGPVIQTWSTVYRRWAANGKRDDGTAYSWARGVEFGKTDILSAIKTNAGVTWDASIYNAAVQTASGSAQSIAKAGEQLVDGAKKAADVLTSPLVKGALVVGAGLLALYFASKIMKSVADLKA